MCGRFTTPEQEIVMRHFSLGHLKDYQRRYNIAPTQNIPAVKAKGKLSYLKWGLIPSWAKDPSIGSKMINARSETILEKPSFRNAFKKRRCLIISGGFYEWTQQESKKQPFFIHLKHDPAFAFAGIWEMWKSPEGEVIETASVLTTESNDLLKPIHHRMPVILSQSHYDQWLSSEAQESDLMSLLRPFESDLMDIYPVSTLVNKPSNDDPKCLERI